MGDLRSLIGAPREWARDLAAATAIGLFLGMIGPFGSFNGGPLELRIPYWIANIWIGFVILRLTVRLSLRGAERFDVPLWFALPASLALGCGPLTVLLSIFSSWFWPHNHAPFFTMYGEILVIAEPCGFAYFALGSGSGPRQRFIRPIAPQTETGPLLQRPPGSSLSPSRRFNPDLLCLQMEDHYVRAHTPTGSDLVLTSLRDAIGELQDVAGLQVHRSWWVRRSAVDGLEAKGRNLALRLTNGLEVPVSRASVAKLKAAGWLAQDAEGRPIFNDGRA